MSAHTPPSPYRTHTNACVNGRECVRERDAPRTNPVGLIRRNVVQRMHIAISQPLFHSAPNLRGPNSVHHVRFINQRKGVTLWGSSVVVSKWTEREKRNEKEENINIQTSGEWGCECLIARVFGGSWTADVDFRCGCVLHTLQPRLPHRWHRLWIQKKTHQLPHHSHFDEWYMFRMPCAE